LVDCLIKIQKIKPKKKIKTIFNNNYSIKNYSIKYLHAESDLFFDWYLPLFLNKKKIKKIKYKSKKILTGFFKQLKCKKTFFVHRDFHASNLMKVGKKVGILDSQDALLGNPSYDLASLIDDVRIKTSNKLKNNILNYYLEKAYKNFGIKREFFLEDFNTLSIQRILKIIGIFSRLSRRDKKNKYLKLIPYCWQLLEYRLKEKKYEDLKVILTNAISKKIRKRKYFS